MRVIFMGTPDFAVGTLEAVITAGHEVVLAVTQPDKPKGRGKSMQAPPVKECAAAHKIPVYQPVRIREAECIAYLKEYQPDIMIVAAFGQILPKEILEMPKYGCVNVHASLLPKYRGAAPIQWAVINGDAAEVVLAEDETGGSLFDRLAEVGAKLCVHTIQAIKDGTAVYTKQNEAEATHVGMIKKQMGNIDWTQSAVTIERLIRGLNPWPSAYTKLNGKTLKIWRAAVEAGGDAKDAGKVVTVNKKELKIQTGDGILSLLEVQLEGKKRMDIEAFLRGYEVMEQTILTME